MSLVDVAAAPGVDAAGLLRLAGALEHASEHPVATAIATGARERLGGDYDAHVIPPMASSALRTAPPAAAGSAASTGFWPVTVLIPSVPLLRETPAVRRKVMRPNGRCPEACPAPGQATRGRFSPRRAGSRRPHQARPPRMVYVSAHGPRVPHAGDPRGRRRDPSRTGRRNPCRGARDWPRRRESRPSSAAWPARRCGRTGPAAHGPLSTRPPPATPSRPAAGPRAAGRPQEQPERDGQHHDHDRAAGEFRGRELPAHQKREDHAQLDDQARRDDLERIATVALAPLQNSERASASVRGRSSPSRRTIVDLRITARTIADSANPRISAQVISGDASTPAIRGGP